MPESAASPSLRAAAAPPSRSAEPPPSQPLHRSLLHSAEERREVYVLRAKRSLWRSPSRNRPDTAASATLHPAHDRPRATVLSPPTPTSRRRGPATEVSLTRVGVTRRREGHPRRRRPARRRRRRAEAGSLFFAELECFVDLNPHQAGVHMSRFEEVVNEAIDDVVLGETLRAEELAAHIAERVRERQQGLRAEVTIAARYPETVPTPASGPPDPGDLHPLRHRGRLRARHPHPHRRRGPGHDRLPLRPGPGRRPRPRAPRRATASPTTRSSASSKPSPSPPTTSAASASLHLGRPEGSDLESRRPRPPAHRRAVDELGDLRADEALRRGSRWSRRPTATPASSRTACARWSAASPSAYPELARRRLPARPPGEPGDDPPPLRRRRALRRARRDPRRARARASTPAPHHRARVARGALRGLSPRRSGALGARRRLASAAPAPRRSAACAGRRSSRRR